LGRNTQLSSRALASLATFHKERTEAGGGGGGNDGGDDNGGDTV
jgi:hypothetical protein